VKILKRTAILKNLIVFLTFSIFYLHVTTSLHEQRSAMDLAWFQSLLFNNKLLLGFYFSAICTVFLAKNSSKLFVLMFFSFVFGHTFYFFLISFDKLILLLNFAYLIFAFCFYLLWRLELDEAYYAPGFSVYDKEIRPQYNFSVELTVVKTNERLKGHLTNWNPNSCFLILEDKFIDLRGEVQIKIDYVDKTFVDRATIVTSYGAGYGLRINGLDGVNFTRLNWASFYDIINDRGYTLNFSKVFS